MGLVVVVASFADAYRRAPPTPAAADAVERFAQFPESACEVGRCTDGAVCRGGAIIGGFF